jgi:glycosyltransferase involved in cell wall biosynthesis
MRILFPLIKLGSGADVYFENLSQELKKEEIDSEINYYSRKFTHLTLLLKLIKKKEKAEIIHTTAELGWVFKQKNIPLYVSVLHIPEKTEDYNPGIIKNIYYKLIIKPQIKLSLKKADKIIAISEFTKKQAQKLTDKEIIVVYPALNLKEFKPLKNIESEDKRFKLFFTGNLVKRKGADLLPKIMKELGQEYVLYYTSGLRSNIPKDFGLANMVPLGRLSQEELVRQYNKSDALLFPTRLEGFGYSVVEAMACGKPVISTNCSSIPELMVDGKNGFLCKSGEVQDFAEKIRLLKTDKNLKNKMKINNLNTIRRFYLNKLNYKKIIING